jgi:hypothetical protein
MGYLGNAPADQAIQIGSDTILSSHIDDGVIVNDDINASASISVSKTALAGGTGLTLSTNTLNVDAAQTQIISVGTIGTGVWQGTKVASAYLDDDTAHLSTNQTFSGVKTFGADYTSFNGTGYIRGDNANKLTLQMGSSGFELKNNAYNATRLTISDSGTATFAGQLRVGGAGSGSSENLLVTSATSSDHTRVHIEKTANAGSAGVSLNSYTPSATWTIYQGDDSDGDLIFYDASDSVLTLATDNSATFAGTLSSTKESSFNDNNIANNGSAGGNKYAHFNVPVRYKGGWELIDAWALGSSSTSYGFNFPDGFQDNPYTHFKIVIPHIRPNSNGEHIFIKLIDESSNVYTASSWYGHKTKFKESSADPSYSRISGSDALEVFDNAGYNSEFGVAGEIYIYNVSTGDPRGLRTHNLNFGRVENFDQDRGQNFRPMVISELGGYHTSGGTYMLQKVFGTYVASDFNSHYRGIQIGATGSGATIKEGSQAYLFGMAL